MSLISKVLKRLDSINTLLNTIASNAKRFTELPPAQSVDLTSIFPIELNGTTYYLTLQQLFDAIQPNAPQIIQETLIPTQANQKTFLVPGNPEQVIVWKGRTNLIQDSSSMVRDFDYDSSTSVIVTTDGLNYDPDPIKSEKLYVTGFSSAIGTIQIIEATEDDQVDFFYSGVPAFVIVMAGRTNMIEGRDYTRTRYSSNNKITFTKGKPINSLVTVIKF